MFWNGSMTSNNTSIDIIYFLDYIKKEYLVHLPVIFIIFGIIGFICNAFTFLQPILRYNTCCIYLFSASIIDLINLFVNLLHNYVNSKTDNILSLITVRCLCKLKVFGLVFLPQLSMNLLTLSLIDRYACTCSLTSSIRNIRRLIMIPWMIILTIILSSIMSFYGPLFHDIVPGFGCVSKNPFVNGLSYIIIHGFITPSVMLIFVFFTYRNVKASRRRAGSKTLRNIDRSRNPFLRMIFTQVFATSILSLQWIIFYIYHMITMYSKRSYQQEIFHYFIWCISNNIYYLINVKSFYLSTLTSRLFRKTFLQALFRLLLNSKQQQENIDIPGSSINVYLKTRPEDKSNCEF